MTIDTERLYINGINGVTGDPLVDPISAAELETAVRQHYSPEEMVIDRKISERSYDGPDPSDPKKAGWGLLVHQDDERKYGNLLSELMKHRNGRLFLYDGEPPSEWTDRNGVESTEFPRYILLAGNPAKVSFELQFALTAEKRFVGRLDFDDEDDFCNYAENVVRAESSQNYEKPAKRAVFFAPKHEGDDFEPYGCDMLARPLFENLSNDPPRGVRFDPPLFEGNATKDKLLDALKQPPGLLFTVSHGIGIERGRTDQQLLQGSLACQDFQPNPTRRSRQGCITGWDVLDKEFRLPGGVHFMFACYGVGTSRKSDFLRWLPAEEQEKSMRTQGTVDFTAHLPKVLLAQGGALAVIGHIDSAFNFGFSSPLTGDPRITPYGVALERLMKGNPVGYAMGEFTSRYGSTSANIMERVTEPGHKLAALWIQRNDARNYMILGDPAVRIQFSED